jgi:hypothetical protein
MVMIIDKSKYMIMDRVLEALSLAIKPLDKMAAPPEVFGLLKISLKDVKRTPVKNPSGYYVYLTLEDDNYTVSIESEYYLFKEFTLTLPNHGSPPGGETDLDEEVKLIDLNGGLLAEVVLIPDVNYPFPTGATLVRGEVKDGSGNPVITAQVSVLGSQSSPPGNDLIFDTNPKGQFLLFCNRLTSGEIIEINGKTYEGERKLKLQATDQNLGDSDTFEIEISDGDTVFQNINY